MASKKRRVAEGPTPPRQKRHLLKYAGSAQRANVWEQLRTHYRWVLDEGIEHPVVLDDEGVLRWGNSATWAVIAADSSVGGGDVKSRLLNSAARMRAAGEITAKQFCAMMRESGMTLSAYMVATSGISQ